MTPFEQALAELESLKTSGSINYTQVAKKYNVDRSTLSRRFRGVQRTKEDQYEEQRLLNNNQTKELIKYINELGKKGLFISQEMLRNFAANICGKEPGKQWPGRFLKQHTDELVYRYMTGMDAARIRADSAYKYSLYFDLLLRKIHEYDVYPGDIYNMDEKGFLIGILAKGKRIFSKRLYEQGLGKERLQDGNREWVTTIACICADGSRLSPALIYQSSASKLQDTWLQDLDTTQQHCFFASSPTGWTNNKLGLAWLRDVFDRETKDKARRRWRLLILDSHGSHLDQDFLQYCDDHKILLMTYPPHSTHSLQPLDVAIFGPLSTAYTNELERFLHASLGISHITKRDFFRLFWPAWNKALSPQNIESAWRATGIEPFNPDIVLQRFTKKDDERPSSSESSRSVLGAEDWRRIQRLVKEVVADIYDESAKKLNSTMHHLATENILLKTQCESLQQALLNEKKKRQRSKPLNLQLPRAEDGYAVFYSPKKIQEARDLQQQKDEAIQAAKAAKEEEKARRMEAKKEKERQVEERRRLAAQNRQRKLWEAEEKKREKEEARTAKQAETQLLNSFKSAQKGKKKAPATPKPKNSKKTVTPEAEEDEGPPPTVNRRGRQIRLPQRFRE